MNEKVLVIRHEIRWCSECPLCHYVYGCYYCFSGGNSYEKLQIDEDEFDKENSIPEWCPLIDVPSRIKDIIDAEENGWR